MVDSTRLDLLKYYKLERERNVLDLIKEAFSDLEVRKEKHITECFSEYNKIYRRLKKGTKCRASHKLAPVVVFLFLKTNNFNISLTEYLKKMSYEPKEFKSVLKQVVSHYPSYLKRDRKGIIVKKLVLIKKYYSFPPRFIERSERILNAFWSQISNTKEDVIVGVACILTIIQMGIKGISFSQICKKVGIELSTVHYQVKHNIFERMRVPNFTSLKKSSSEIKKVIDWMIK